VIFVSLWLAAFCWTKSHLCNDAYFIGMLLYSKSTLQLWASRRLCARFKTVLFSFLASVRTKWNSVRTLICQSIIRPKNEIFPSERPSVSKSFELLLVPFVQTPFSVRQVKRFLSKTQIWEDSCNRPGDMAIPSGRYPW